MANSGPIVQNYAGTTKWVLDTTVVVPLNAADDDVVSQFVVQVQLAGFTGSFTPKQTVTGSGLSGGNLIPCVYYSTAAETAIAANVSSNTAGIYYIPSDGLSSFLDFTISAGTATLYVRKFRG